MIPHPYLVLMMPKGEKIEEKLMLRGSTFNVLFRTNVKVFLKNNCCISLILVIRLHSLHFRNIAMFKFSSCYSKQFISVYII